MLLNIGSGAHPAPGWLNIDPDALWPADERWALPHVPLADGVAERAYLGHLLEHLWPEELTPALCEVARLLKPGGVLMVVGPCIGKALDQAEWALAARIVGLSADQDSRLVGGGTRPLGSVEPWGPGSHKWVSTEALTARALRLVGFNPEIIDVAMVRQPEWPNPAPDAKWQTAMRVVL